MAIEFKIKKNTYYDSLRLLRISKTISDTKGVKSAVAVMSTEKAKFALKSAGLIKPEIDKAGGNDLVIIVEADTKKTAKEAINKTEELISSGSGRNKNSPPDILNSELQIINIGLEIFKDSLADQGAKIKHVEWQIPAKGDTKMIKLLKKLT